MGKFLRLLQRPVMTLDHILRTVCTSRGVAPEEVLGRSRKQYIKDTRHIFIEIAIRCGHPNTNSNPAVMNFLGRNRSTLFNSRNVARWQLSTEVERCYSFVTHSELFAHLDKRREQRKKLAELFGK